MDGRAIFLVVSYRFRLSIPPKRMAPGEPFIYYWNTLPSSYVAGVFDILLAPILDYFRRTNISLAFMHGNSSKYAHLLESESYLIYT